MTAQCKDDILADKQKWADDLATEAELALKGQVKDAFANLRRLRSACPRISSPISLVDGTLVSDKPQKLQRWKDKIKISSLLIKHVMRTLLQIECAWPAKAGSAHVILDMIRPMNSSCSV